jgi:opacity protein-like surface antigen
MKTKFFLAAALMPLFAMAQGGNNETKDFESGKLQLGMRTVVSAFSDSKYSGFGLGGQFRLKLQNRLNTEWFADYITTNISDYAMRTDYHIGWAVQYYAFNNVIEKGKFTPYIEAGHCFDYTSVTLNSSDPFTYYSSVSSLSRWSSAIHAGLGTCYNISDNFDVSLAAMYMLHLGKDIHTDIVNGPSDIPTVNMYKSSASLEGHLLITLSLNVYIGKLWGREKS